eukprot:TRINITY_DN2008_c0_g1_i1.p1 TRINITY_DN2008_c0_g1~~TRINITY_DN2008_c0_g1_i1.p1  ORF type:complete len:561 (-),score=131.41 TRINITY_DN2008_c0_g1_i1:216-1898(-)
MSDDDEKIFEEEGSHEDDNFFGEGGDDSDFMREMNEAEPQRQIRSDQDQVSNISYDPNNLDKEPSPQKPEVRSSVTLQREVQTETRVSYTRFIQTENEWDISKSFYSSVDDLLALNRQLTEARTNLLRESSNNESLRNDMSRVITEKEQKINDIMRERDALKQINGALNNQNSNLNKKVLETESQLHRERIKIAELYVEVAKLKNQLQEQSNGVQVANVETEVVVSENEQLKQRVHSLKEENERLKKEYGDSKKLLLNLKKAVENSGVVALDEESFENVEQVIASVRDIMKTRSVYGLIKMLTREISKVREAATGGSQLKQRTDEIATLKAQNRILKDENASLERILKSRNDEIVKLNQQTLEVQSLREELDEVERRMQQQEVLINSLQKEVGLKSTIILELQLLLELNDNRIKDLLNRFMEHSSGERSRISTEDQRHALSTQRDIDILFEKVKQFQSDDQRIREETQRKIQEYKQIFQKILGWEVRCSAGYAELKSMYAKSEEDRLVFREVRGEYEILEKSRPVLEKLPNYQQQLAKPHPILMAQMQAFFHRASGKAQR